MWLTRAKPEAMIVEVTATPLFSGGKVVGVVAVWHDMTEQRRWEATLAEAKREAEEANRAKSQFLANMSHEIRTPLNAILGFAELMAKPGLPNERRAEFSDMIMRSGKQLNSLIRDILDLSKVEADRLLVESAPVTLAVLLDEVRGTFSQKAGEAGLSFVVQEGLDLPEAISSDALRLKQILFNLIGNAIKFTPAPGCVGVFVTHDRSIRQIRFTIADSGIGISDADRSLIFEPFHQADSSITRRFGGTGLGLTLSRRLARLLGGDLWLSQSEIGHGSTFVLVLPAEEPEVVAQPEGRSVDAEHRLDGMDILVAEDIPAVQLLMQTILESCGAHTTVVDNGTDAVARALERSFDVILMDIRMPGKDGLTATRELRQQGYDGPILALTAHAFKDEQLKSLEAGCNGHLNKPVSSDDLVAMLQRFQSRA